MGWLKRLKGACCAVFACSVALCYSQAKAPRYTFFDLTRVTVSGGIPTQPIGSSYAVNNVNFSGGYLLSTSGYPTPVYWAQPDPALNVPAQITAIASGLPAGEIRAVGNSRQVGTQQLNPYLLVNAMAMTSPSSVPSYYDGWLFDSSGTNQPLEIRPLLTGSTPTTSVRALALNDLPQAVGTTTLAGSSGAFFFDDTVNPVQAQTLPIPSNVQTSTTFPCQALGINDGVEVVGTTIGTLNGVASSYATIWQGTRNSQGSGYTFQAANIKLLGPGSAAQSVNNVGEIAGSIQGKGPVLWEPGGSVKYLAAGQSSVTGGTSFSVNDRGEVVGVVTYGNGTITSFYWDSNSGFHTIAQLIQDRSDSGYTNLIATGISGTGRISGYATVGGVVHGFELKPSSVIQVLKDDLLFGTSAPQSIFYQGQGAFHIDKQLKVSWGPAGKEFSHIFTPEIGPWTVNLGFVSFTIGPFSLGKFGVDGGLYAGGANNTPGYLGLEAKLDANLGSANLTMPLAVTMNFPDKDLITPGEVVPVVTSYTVDPSSSLTVNGEPSLTAELDYIANIENQCGVNAYAFGDEILSYNLIPSAWQSVQIPGANGTGQIYKVSLDTSTLEDEEEIPSDQEPYITVTAHAPNLMASALVNPNISQPTFDTHAQDSVLTFAGSITNFLSENILGFPLTLAFGLDLGVGSIDFLLEILQLDAEVELDLANNIHFVANPLVSFQVPSEATPQFPLGTNTTVTMPADGSALPLKPLYHLDSSFATSLQFIGTGSLNFDPFHIAVNANAFGYQLIDLDWSPWQGNIDLGSFSFNAYQPAPWVLGGVPDLNRGTFRLTGTADGAPTIRELSTKSLPLYLLDYFGDNEEGEFASFVQTSSNGNAALNTQPLFLVGDNIDSTTVASIEFMGRTVQASLVSYPPDAAEIEVPNYLCLVPGTMRVTLQNTLPNGKTVSSNSANLSVAAAPPIVSRVGPNLWASDPTFGSNLVLAVVGQNFFPRWDYYWETQASYNAGPSENDFIVFWNRYLSKTKLLIDPNNPNGATDFSTWLPEAAKLYGSPNYVPLATVLLNGQPLSPYYEPADSDGFNWHVLPHSAFQHANLGNIQVQTASGVGTYANDLLIAEPLIQTLSSITPTNVIPGASQKTLRVYTKPVIPTTPGVAQQHFCADSVILLNGKPVATTFVNAHEVDTTLPASMLAQAGAITVQVKNSGPGAPSGGFVTSTSNSLTLAVGSPTPSIAVSRPSTTIINAATGKAITTKAVALTKPAQLICDDQAVLSSAQTWTLQVFGSNFVPGSFVTINGTQRVSQLVPDTYGNSANQAKPYETLEAQLLPSDVAKTGALSIAVVNPGGLTSNSVTVNVVDAGPAPAGTSVTADQTDYLTVDGFVTSMSSSGVFTQCPPTASFTIYRSKVPSTGCPLNIQGTGFCSGSTVRLFGVTLSNVYSTAAPTSLSATILAGQLPPNGKYMVTVTNPAPGGGNVTTTVGTTTTVTVTVTN